MALLVFLWRGSLLAGASRVLDVPMLGVDLDLHVGVTDVFSITTKVSQGQRLFAMVADRCLRITVDKPLGAISLVRMLTFLQEQPIPLDEIRANELDGQVLAPRERFAKAFDALIAAAAIRYVVIAGALDLAGRPIESLSPVRLDNYAFWHLQLRVTKAPHKSNASDPAGSIFRLAERAGLITI